MGLPRPKTAKASSGKLRKSKSYSTLGRSARKRKKKIRSFRKTDNLRRLSSALVVHSTQVEEQPDTFFGQLETMNSVASRRTLHRPMTARSRRSGSGSVSKMRRRNKKIYKQDAEQMELMEHVRDMYFKLKTHEQQVSELEWNVDKKRRKLENAENFAQRIVNESMLYCPDNNFLKLVRAENSCALGLREKNRHLSKTIQQHKQQLTDWTAKISVEKFHGVKEITMEQTKELQSLRDSLHMHLRRFGMNQMQEIDIHRLLAQVDSASRDVVEATAADHQASHKVDLLQQHIVAVVSMKERNNTELTLLVDDLARVAQNLQSSKTETDQPRVEALCQTIADIQGRQEQRNIMYAREQPVAG